MPKLFVLSGPDAGRRFEVGTGAVIGRASECAVQLHDVSVSRHHARIETDGGDWKVVDTGSRNGVRFQGARVPGAELRDGDEFQVGEVLLRFRVDDAEKPRALPEAAARPSAPPADEPDEITIEEEPVAAATDGVAETRTFTQPLARAPESVQPGQPTRVAPARPGETVQRGQRVLQYQRIQAREGFFASDLAQQSTWVRVAVGLLALAVFVAIFLVAFRGTSFLKSRAGGGSVEDASEPAAEESR